MSGVRTELDTALATARHALEQVNAEPLVASKRGGPRLSPWWRVWVQASEVAQRWHRQLELEKPEPSIQDEVGVLNPSRNRSYALSPPTLPPGSFYKRIRQGVLASC
jgi:hypothetical protein